MTCRQAYRWIAPRAARRGGRPLRHDAVDTLTRARPAIPRAALAGRIEAAGRPLLTLVAAPAGYGKTTLLAQRHAAEGEAGRPSAWIALGQPPVDAAALMDAACAGLAPLGPSPSGRRSAIQLAADLAAAREPIALFLDNAQRLDAEALQCLRELILALPNLRWVIAARGDIPLPVGRLRALGQLFEVGAEDLAFDDQEAAAFLREAGLDVSVPDALHRRLMGWPAGYSLLAASQRRPAVRRPKPEAIEGGWPEFAAFFAEEVMEAQTERQRRFLQQISILDAFDADLCEAVTEEPDAAALIEQCRQAGAFLAPIASGGWALHPLFREFLRARLDRQGPPGAAPLHARAMAWSAAHGRHDAAFEHALALGDPAQAAAHLNAHCIAVAGAAEERGLAALADKIPPALQRLYPRIGLGKALQLILSFQFEAAERTLADCGQRIDELKQSGAAEEEVQPAEALLRHRQMMLSLAQGDMRLARQLCTALIREYGAASSNNRLSVFTSLVHAQVEHMDFGEIDRLYLLAKSDAYRVSDPIQYLPLERVHAHYLFLTGRSERAIAVLRGEVRKAEALFGKSSEFGALAALTLAAILYETDQTRDAKALVDDYLPASERYGFIDSMLTGRIVKARLQHLAGDRAGCLESLQTWPATSGEFLEQFRLTLTAERIHWLLRDGETAAAIEAARAIGLSSDPRTVMPLGKATLRDDARAAAWVRLARARDHLGDALNVARHWRSIAARQGSVYNTVRWDLLQASLLLQQGESRTAQRMLRRAIAAAASGRLIRTFLDEGPAVAALILQSPQIEASRDEAEAQFLADLARACGGAAAPAPRPAPTDEEPAETLSSKELDILRLVAKGMINREIGDLLGMTTGTVKWYMQGVYHKLGVRRRAQAAAVGRRLGYVP